MELNSNEYYLADSYQNLERVGNIFIQDGKEYINVILKSGKIHAARVYRSDKAQTASTKTRHIVYDTRKELGFAPSNFIYLVRHPQEEKLNGICQWHPGFGAYLKCTDDIFDLPFGCKIEKLSWLDVTKEDCVHLLSIEKIRDIVKNKILRYVQDID